jgi:hypothetical protein
MMLDWMLNGFIHTGLVLALALLTMGTAFAFAVRPSGRRFGFLRPLSAATTFSIVSAMCAGIGATFLHACSVPEASPGNTIPTVMAGLAESMVPPILGFSILALSWLLTAVGLRRQES